MPGIPRWQPELAEESLTGTLAPLSSMLTGLPSQGEGAKRKETLDQFLDKPSKSPLKGNFHPCPCQPPAASFR